ncbi:hypothetical protein LCGC14_1758510 [marine sediment metagenome]|uniref:Methyltransferase type 11 domain-containing protein n=1 Tax=marine sediment metagenome TaxID=412755 RepID=A0A0F9K1D3_9ZZZZ
MLDSLQEKYKHLYKGVVLDIGGRDRGNFVKPKDLVDKWIFADINEKYKPDVLLDVTNMNQIESDTIDVVNAIELFEHVKDYKKGLKECYRVLKKRGVLILSTPFLIHIHADPGDYQRISIEKWKLDLLEIGFKYKTSIIMGKYFTHLAETIKDLFIACERRKIHGSTLLLRMLHPLLDKLLKLDNRSFVRNDSRLNFYHTGYFIIAKK